MTLLCLHNKESLLPLEPTVFCTRRLFMHGTRNRIDSRSHTRAPTACTSCNTYTDSKPHRAAHDHVT